MSKLKPFHSRLQAFGTDTDTFTRPDPVAVNSEGAELFAIDKILDKRIRYKHPEYLVHFTGYPDSHVQWEALTPANRTTWEDDWALLQQFDPSVGPFRSSELPSRSHPRRSTRSVRFQPANV